MGRLGIESAITVHKVVEVEGNGTTSTEKIDRVIELGTAHTAEDLASFLEDLKVPFISGYET